MGKRINNDLLDELLKGCERPEDLLGDGGLMKDLKKALMQRMLGGRADGIPRLRVWRGGSAGPDEPPEWRQPQDVEERKRRVPG